MHAILTSFGSTGDLMPLLSVGLELMGRGHRVTVVSGEGFRGRVEESGLDFFSICGAEEYERSIREVGVLASRYRGMFFRRYVVGWNAALLRFLADEGKEDAIYISAERPTLWADLCAHRHFRVPCVRLAIDLPVPPARDGNRAVRPPGIGSAPAQLMEAWQYEWRKAARGAGVNAGPRHTERLARATVMSVPRIALWPEWFAPGAGRNLARVGFVGAPRNCRLPIGDCQFSESDSRQSTIDNRQSRSRLVFIAGSLGTTANWERGFAEASREICGRLGCDGLVLGGTPPADFRGSESFAWRKYVPLEAVLPAAAAVVHHGGIGTTAAALRAAVPQLIIPRVFGQSANAICARKLGVAAVMAPEDYNADTGAGAIGTLVSDHGYRTRSRSLAEKIDLARDRARVADFVEGWATKSKLPISDCQLAIGPSERSAIANRQSEILTAA